MTMDEIRQAWAQSPMWGKNQEKEREGSTHDKFRQKMEKKTDNNRNRTKYINEYTNKETRHLYDEDIGDAAFREANKATGEILTADPIETKEELSAEQVAQDMEQQEQANLFDSVASGPDF